MIAAELLVNILIGAGAYLRFIENENNKKMTWNLLVWSIVFMLFLRYKQMKAGVMKRVKLI